MNIAVIFAGGVGTRMNSKERPKQFLEVHNKPIIVHTIEHFQYCDSIDIVVVACVESGIEHLKDLIYQYRLDKVVSIVPGGESGQLSIYNGLVEAERLAEGQESIVLIHDGVRPLINKELIENNIRDVKQYGSSITTGIVKETIIETLDDGTVKTVPDRAHSRLAKAPQCFYLADILKVHRQAMSEGKTNFIDSCTMMNSYGYKLHVTDGPYENMKITTPDDFYSMRAILQAKEDKQIYGFE